MPTTRVIIQTFVIVVIALAVINRVDALRKIVSA